MKSKLTPIYKLPLEQNFKWHGVKYTQLSRPCDCKIGQKVDVCRSDFDLEWMSFPSGRLVKPIVVFNGREL
jgi:hypothetical protein